MSSTLAAMALYYPPPGEWERIDPASAAIRPDALRSAAAFAVEHDSDWPASLHLPDGRYVGNAFAGDRPPHDRPLGIVRPRGPACGLIVRGGRIVAEWGDVQRADTTFSVAKSFLALLCGFAVDDGLIGSVDDPVAGYMPDSDLGFAAAQNRAVTWRHLLQQTSEWQGSVWGIPDSVDHHRHFGTGSETREPGATRAHEAPGCRWEYNDVRINRLALSLLQVFRRPLPEVLRERLMEPIGASDRWQWHGYRNAIADVGGRALESVSGGAHWGGGLFISAIDQARVGCWCCAAAPGAIGCCCRSAGSMRWRRRRR
ncbi:MAG TPA: serine hydrolase domain-containing protein [Burkholderiaceae bacterium]|nr:serine hydrolase domain-containing protein [Burkholderiaceae bacterium]